MKQLVFYQIVPTCQHRHHTQPRPLPHAARQPKQETARGPGSSCAGLHRCGYTDAAADRAQDAVACGRDGVQPSSTAHIEFAAVSSSPNCFSSCGSSSKDALLSSLQTHNIASIGSAQCAGGDTTSCMAAGTSDQHTCDHHLRPSATFSAVVNKRSRCFAYAEFCGSCRTFCICSDSSLMTWSMSCSEPEVSTGTAFHGRCTRCLLANRGTAGCNVRLLLVRRFALNLSATFAASSALSPGSELSYCIAVFRTL